ncbi:MAG: methyl-accepting chemotaxis protein [Treponema sp.]|jgi:methyl-accepting chemotaxis protein|nr:methyl-accepting chemotaxis protein [Treponema sp.]
MKLKTKFTLVSVWLILQLFLLVAGMSIGYGITQSVKNYQYELVRAHYHIEDLSEFIEQIDSRGIDFSTLYQVWTQKFLQVRSDFALLNTNPARNFFSAELNSELDEIQEYWKILEDRCNDLDAAYKKMTGCPCSDDLKKNIAVSGITEAVAPYLDKEDIADLVTGHTDAQRKIPAVRSSKQQVALVIGSVTVLLDAAVARYNRLSLLAALCLALVSSAVVLTVILLSTTGLIKRIKILQRMSEKLADKDFTVKVTPEGSTEMFRLMQDLDDTVLQLNKFFMLIKQTAENILVADTAISDSVSSTSSATSQIKAGIESISSEFGSVEGAVKRSIASIRITDQTVRTVVMSTEQQTEAINESSAAVLAMTNTIGMMSTKIQERKKSTEAAQRLVQEGGDKITSVSNGLQQVTSQLDEVNEIVTIINSIAEQTNILSINAAIESAHAGSSGAGFAVVADEIRSLAESTEINAKRISTSVGSIVATVKQANMTSNDAAEAFTLVSKNVYSMMDFIREIADGIRNIDDKSQNITAKISETAGTAEKINGYCENLNGQQEKVSNEVAALHEIFTQSMNGLKEILDSTHDIIKRMQLVNERSTDSYEKVIHLQKILAEFKTAGEQTLQPSPLASP